MQDQLQDTTVKMESKHWSQTACPSPSRATEGAGIGFASMPSAPNADGVSTYDQLMMPHRQGTHESGDHTRVKSHVTELTADTITQIQSRWKGIITHSLQQYINRLLQFEEWSVICPHSPHLTSSHLTSPHLTSPHLTSPHLTSPHPTPPHLTSPHFTSLSRFAPHRLASPQRITSEVIPHLTSRHATSRHVISPLQISPQLNSSHRT